MSNQYVRLAEQDQSRFATDRAYSPSDFVRICGPVFICMMVVLISVNWLQCFREHRSVGVDQEAAQSDIRTMMQTVYSPFHTKTESLEQSVAAGVLNASVILLVVIAMTIIVYNLYKYGYYKIIYGWIYGSCLMVLFVWFMVFLYQAFLTANIAIDIFSATLIGWNVGSVGFIIFTWNGPRLLHHAYLMLVSILMALLFLFVLPGTTIWVLLILLVAWDLVAVLAPFGPLRKLIDLHNERNDFNTRALVYTSLMMYRRSRSEGLVQHWQSRFGEEKWELRRRRVGRYEDDTDRHSTTSTPATVGAGHVESDQDVLMDQTEFEDYQQESLAFGEEEGLHIGLGDFIFYSLLIGKASTYGDWTATLACAMGILAGLVVTLFLLSNSSRALPALPFSIVGGLVCFALGYYVVSPFVQTLSVQQVFI